MKGRWRNGCYHNGSIMGIVDACTYILSVFQQVSVSICLVSNFWSITCVLWHLCVNIQFFFGDFIAFAVMLSEWTLDGLFHLSDFCPTFNSCFTFLILPFSSLWTSSWSVHSLLCIWGWLICTFSFFVVLIFLFNIPPKKSKVSQYALPFPCYDFLLAFPLLLTYVSYTCSSFSFSLSLTYVLYHSFTLVLGCALLHRLTNYGSNSFPSY